MGVKVPKVPGPGRSAPTPPSAAAPGPSRLLRPPAPYRRESLAQTVARRLVSIPCFVIAAILFVITSPLLLPLLATWDTATGADMARTRVALMLGSALVCEAGGLLVALAVGLTWPFLSPTRYADLNFTVQAAWGGTLFRLAETIFEFRTAVQVDVPAGGTDIGTGPLIVFSRHASLADTLLPTALLGRSTAGLRLRYVIKAANLWDPCLDVVGARVPHCFVCRDQRDTPAMLAAVGAAARAMGPRDGVVIFPEGTRFSPKRRDAAVQRLVSSPSKEVAALGLAERAAQFTHVLPPKLGGALAMLEESDATSQADALFIAHAGFEGSANWGRLIAGELIKRPVHVGVWRVPYADIPRERSARILWFYDQWARVDRFVEYYSCQDEERRVKEAEAEASAAASQVRTGSGLMWRADMDATSFLTEQRFAPAEATPGADMQPPASEPASHKME